MIESCDLLSLLNLLLIRFDFSLELINQALHALMVLLILILLVGELLDASLTLPQIFLSISIAPAFSIKLRLQLTNSGLHLGNCLFASFESILLSFIKSCTGILNLSLQKLAVTLNHHSSLLFTSKL